MAESDRNSSNILQEWKNLFQMSQLSKHHFRAFWKEEVPTIFTPRPTTQCLSALFDENAARSVFLTNLELFMFDKPLPFVLDEIKAAERPPVLCGRVFKVGEPTYSCRDCGMDLTCVLCVDCFKMSAHKNHRYKMSTSGGGGYCDCGDKEAWKSHPFCDVHEKGACSEELASPLDSLPQDMIGRCRLIFSTVLDYCYQMLIWEKPMSLPDDLKLEKDNVVDSFATMLFNDEVHTYEQVIRTLQRAIDCTHKEAIDYATTVDREGRSIVKCANFNVCNQVKGMVERITSQHGPKPLKVTVMHTTVVAHQTFALRLLSWLQQLVSSCQTFRLLFSEAISQPRTNDKSILEGLLGYDTQLWKMARTQWHQLFISGMLMEQSSKKTFSKIFTRNYPSLMKDFIADDHDHSLSVTSLSVQIFTVPTLAHLLIMEENVLAILLRTFNTECETKLNAENKLAFERNQTLSTFRRAQYVLFDLKYLLSYKPDQWNGALRRNFLHGFSKLLDLLSYMQGMDITVRQVGQHMEFEPEWESAFNLYIRLTPVINLVLEWCGSDRIVLIKAYRAALKKLSSLYSRPVSIVHEVADHVVACISYDVSSQPVSIHLPLSRMVAGLHLHLDSFDLNYDSPEFSISDKPNPVFIMELPLRTQVMIAQVHAGMWRRNGYSLVNQIYFYHNVRCRAEMYDRDIVMLQIGAALIEGNEFLIHLLNKFGLMNWVRSDYETEFSKWEEDSVRQIITLVEEFLTLLIIIVSERFVPGVGQVTDEVRVRKEIIQQLCIEPMTHSQLSKTLPEDVNHETGLETVISQVATFRKPHGSGKGIYELKSEFYQEYNLFFYHYGREEQSKAEEAQRKRKKQSDEEECCPPPVPPPLSNGFISLINVLQCDVMLQIMRIILERCYNLRSRTFSEAQFQKLLHLIGYALHEEQRSLESGAPVFGFVDRAVKENILSLLEKLAATHQRIDSHKELLNWVQRKFCHVQKLQYSSVSAGVNESDVTPMEVSTSLEDDPVSLTVAREEKKRRTEKAAARRARILAQMSDMQKNFIREHAELFEKTHLADSKLSGSAMDLTEITTDETPVCLGPQQTMCKWIPNRHTCILCQEDQDVTSDGRAMVFSALVQKSTVLSKNRNRILDNVEEYDPLFTPADLFVAPHTSTCGHVMHSDCWQKYLESVVTKEQRRSIRIRHHLSFDVNKQEFLCPLCECLSNTVIPIVPALRTLLPEVVENKVTLSMDEWLTVIQLALEHPTIVDIAVDDSDGATQPQSSETMPSKPCIRPSTLDVVCQHLDSSLSAKLRELYPSLDDSVNCETGEPHFSDSLTEMIKLFAQATYTVSLGVEIHYENERVPVMAWHSCAYTIHTIENLLRDQGKPLFGELTSRQSDCLSVLTRFASVCAQASPPSVVQNHCRRLLATVMHLDQNKLQVLQVDAFGVLVTLVFLLPYLMDRDITEASCRIPQGSSMELMALQFVYVLHIVQILLTSTDFRKNDVMNTEDDHYEADCLVVMKICKQIQQSSNSPTSNDILIPPSLLIRELQQKSVPFLRCCALFFHCLTGVPPPHTLCELPENEYEPLCHYLGLTTSFTELFESPRLQILIEKWISVSNKPDAIFKGIRYPLEINQLWKLPSDYSELINEVSLFTCPNWDGEDSRTPTMCLVCGKILCSQSYCCQTDLDGILVGACTNHAHFCGAGVGIFLRVRECKILLLFGKTKGCFFPPPYLDQYGETDQGLRRGNPLHLCEENYKKLHKLWLSHGIPEEIAHSLESNAHIISVDWQHL